MVKKLAFKTMNMPSKWPVMSRDAHVKIEVRNDRMVVQASGVYASRLLYQAGGTDSVK